MPLADLAHDDIDAEALRNSVADGEREGIRVEFKSAVGDGPEWCLDVTAFANTAGGVILIGASEAEGRLVALDGVDGSVDDEILRLENMLRDLVDPPLPGFRISPVAVDGVTVLVVTVPRSWRAPHLVRGSKRRWSLAKRNSAGKHTLDAASEWRIAFFESDDAGERARRWHDDVVAQVAAGMTPVAVDRNRYLVLTFRPLGAGAPGSTPVLDVAEARRNTSVLSHAVFLKEAASSWGTRVNLDGVYVAVSGAGESFLGYTQVFRDGTVSYVDEYVMTEDDEVVRGIPFAARVVGAFLRTPKIVEWAGAGLPMVAQLTMMGCRGRPFIGDTGNSPRMLQQPAHVFDRDVVSLPPVIVDRVPADLDDAGLLARPMLDALWNAAGYAQCHLVDDDEGWLGHRDY